MRTRANRSEPRYTQLACVLALLAFAAAGCDRAQPPGEESNATAAHSTQVPEQAGGISADHESNLIDQLMAIGYLRGTRHDSRSGVTIHDRERAYPGYNLYVSGHAPEATLIDMDGGVVHRWQFAYEDAFGPLAKPNDNAGWWRRVVAFPNGDLLAIYEGLGLIKIDKHSKLIWKSELDAHHDLEVQPRGEIYVLTRKAHVVPRIDPTRPILEDFVTVLGPTGEFRKEWSLLEAFEGSRFEDLVNPDFASGNGDLFHTNTIAVLPGFGAQHDRAFRPGNLLVSMNRMGVVAVVSPRNGKVIWVRRTAVVGQHDPKLLPNGNMLLFTNNMNGDASVVEEFHPKQGDVAWSYRGSDTQPFYSKYLGAAERMPNGNTLITESEGGRAFEVTPKGEIVWEFYNPHRTGEGSDDAGEEGFIATLPEVVRLPGGIFLGWADGPAAPHLRR
ncbi:MAG: arylsulfotransferase family protein [Myxococcota bacterium]|nr:arylsulfotransferase family protein [Myxococcota bacterium]